MMLPFGLGAGAALWMAFAVFGAAFVRGYSGFGFAALVVTSAAMVTDPLHFVPVVVMADIVLTVQQARGIRAHVEWRRVLPMLAGCVIGVPLGLLALQAVGVDAARAAISVFVLAICGILLTDLRLRRPVGHGGHAAVGVVSGLANGAAVGGLPVAAFFTAAGVAPAAFRATLIAYFTLMDLWTLPLMAATGMITRDTLLATALGLPLMSAGVWLGSRRFLKTAPQDFRRFAILLLMALSALGLLKSLV